MKKLIILGICLTFGLSACNKNSVKMDYDGTTIKDSDINIREGVRIVFDNKTTQNINPKNFKENIPVIDKRLDSIGLRGHYIFMEDDKIVVITTPVKDPDRLAKFLSKKVNLVFKEPDSNNLLVKKYPTNDSLSLAKDKPINQDLIFHTSYLSEPSSSNWQVVFKLNEKGSKIFKDISGKYLNQKFLMELDNQLLGPKIVNETDLNNSFGTLKLSPVLKLEKNNMILSYISPDLAQKLKSKDLQIKFQEPVNDPETKTQKRSECCLLWQNSMLTKDMIETVESRPITDNKLLNKKLLMLTFNEEGKSLLAEFTKKYANREINVELDGKVISSSRIYEPIKDGRLSVYLPDSFDNENIIELSSQLQSGQPVSDLNISEVITF